MKKEDISKYLDGLLIKDIKDLDEDDIRILNHSEGVNIKYNNIKDDKKQIIIELKEEIKFLEKHITDNITNFDNSFDFEKSVERLDFLENYLIKLTGVRA